jgi:hypothetical protein
MIYFNTEYYDQFVFGWILFQAMMEVIDTLTQKYVNYYRQMHMNPKPNTQQA